MSDVDGVRAILTYEDWCREQSCLSNFMDMQTGKPYPCGHKQGRLADAVPSLLDRIAALEAETARLRAALVNIVSSYNSADWCGWCQRLMTECRTSCAAGQARAALAASAGEG